MFLRYKPVGAEKETIYEFRPEKTDFNRARIAEKNYTKLCGERRHWEQMVADARMGSIAARKVALWLAITDVHPMTRFEDVPDFAVGELTMEYSYSELVEMREDIAANTTMVESEKQAMLAGLDRELGTALGRPDEVDEPVPAVEEPPGKEETGEASTN